MLGRVRPSFPPLNIMDSVGLAKDQGEEDLTGLYRVPAPWALASGAIPMYGKGCPKSHPSLLGRSRLLFGRLPFYCFSLRMSRFVPQSTLLLYLDFDTFLLTASRVCLHLLSSASIHPLSTVHWRQADPRQAYAIRVPRCYSPPSCTRHAIAIQNSTPSLKLGCLKVEIGVKTEAVALNSEPSSPFVARAFP